MGKTLEETVKELRPIDDVFFQKLANEPGFCEEVLQVILQKKDLKVIKVETQKNLRNVKGRSVVVDVVCVDSKNTYYNIEVQKSDNDDHERRVRYNGANIDTFITEKGKKFKELPDLYIVYISSFDFFKKNKTIYHVDRVLRETGDVVDNGFYEVYVNTQVDDKTEISELMKLFKSSDAKGNPKFPNVSRAIKHFKTGKEQDIMCKAVEEYAAIKAEEAARKATKEAEKAARKAAKEAEKAARKAVKEAEKAAEEKAAKETEEITTIKIYYQEMKLTKEQIAEKLNLSVERVEKIISKLQ